VHELPLTAKIFVAERIRNTGHASLGWSGDLNGDLNDFAMIFMDWCPTQ